MSKNEDLKLCEEKHLKFVDGIFCKVTTKNGCSTLVSRNLEDPFFNLVTQITVDDDARENWLEEIEEDYSANGRALTLYVTPYTKPACLGNLLTSRKWKYLPTFKDVWLQRTPIEFTDSLPPELTIEQVNDSAEATLFADLFRKSFAVAELGKPEIEVNPAYTEIWGQALNKPGTELFIASVNGTPAACAALLHDNEVGGLYGLGVLPEFRGKQLGAIFVNFRLGKAKDLNLNRVFVQVEPGSANEKHFNALKFEKLGTCQAFQVAKVVR